MTIRQMVRHKAVKLLMALLLTCTGYVAWGASLLKYSVAQYSARSGEEIIFTFDNLPDYRFFKLSNPERMVFDFTDTRMPASITSLSQRTKFIEAVRFAKHGQSKLRLVLDVPPNTQLQTEKSGGKYLKLHLFHKSKTATPVKPSVPKIKATVSPKATIKPTLEHRPLVARTKLRDVIVVIDPGHGGKDPGAIGQHKIREKDVVLAIAKKLKSLIDKQPGMKAYLTRKGDYYIGLRHRLVRARKFDADIFISIHADAYRNTRSRGASVYALSQRGATSEAARWLAAKENHSELGGVDLSELDDANGMLRSVLIDLSQTATIGASLSLGENVLNKLDNFAQLHHKSVEQARFVVLKSPDIPSILVETGFISNYQEERLLSTPRYQLKLARAILRGLYVFFSDHPPRNSYFAYQNFKYKVVRGDNLSIIANRFKVTIAELKRINKLSSSVLRIGQQLIIPRRS